MHGSLFCQMEWSEQTNSCIYRIQIDSKCRKLLRACCHFNLIFCNWIVICGVIKRWWTLGVSCRTMNAASNCRINKFFKSSICSDRMCQYTHIHLTLICTTHSFNAAAATLLNSHFLASHSFFSFDSWLIVHSYSYTYICILYQYRHQSGLTFGRCMNNTHTFQHTWFVGCA